MNPSRKIPLTILYGLMTLLPGPIFYCLYHKLVEIYPCYSMSIAAQKSNLAVIIATFSFTMLGFLSAVITILFSFAGSVTFKKYKKKGYLDVFFCIYYLSISNLVVTFFLAILSLSKANGFWVMRFSLMSTVDNFVQVAILTTIIVNLCRRLDFKILNFITRHSLFRSSRMKLKNKA